MDNSDYIDTIELTDKRDKRKLLQEMLDAFILKGGTIKKIGAISYEESIDRHKKIVNGTVEKKAPVKFWKA